jgi:hypothetical protein
MKLTKVSKSLVDVIILIKIISENTFQNDKNGNDLS